MFRTFNCRTTDEAWKMCAASFRSGDGIEEQPSRAGLTQEILHAAISIESPTQRWVASREPPINLAFALAEIVWIMTGRQDSAFLNYFNRSLPKYAGCGPSYHGAYGYRLRRHFQVDQLDRAYQVLSSNRSSRQVVLQIWDGRVDLPNMRGEPSAPDIPCNVMSILKVRREALEWTQIVRSNDLFRGLPYNLAQFTALQEILAGWLEVDVGSYNQISDSLHVYKDDLEAINASSPIEAAGNRDSLALGKADSEESFEELGRRVDSITRRDARLSEIFSTAALSDLPAAFQNISIVLCSEVARRLDGPDVAHQIMQSCTNPAYKQLYDRWLCRFSKQALRV